MKTKITLILLMCIFCANAQVTEIFVPNTFFVGSNNGATVPFYQKDGFIYCISQKTIGNTEGKIFKINQTTNAVTEIQENNPFYFNNGMGDLPIYKGEYNDKIFFTVWQSNAMLMNTTNNTITTNYFQYGALNKAFENYLITGLYKKNIDTDLISNIGTTNSVYNNQPTSVNIVETSPIVNSSFYATHLEYVPSTGNLMPNKIFKFTNSNSLNYNLEYIAPTNHYIQGIFNGVGAYDLYQIGNKLIFSEIIYPCCPYNSVLKSKDVNNNQVTSLLTTTENSSYIKSFIYNNELYFYLNTDTSFIKKTNGTTVVNTNLADANYYGYLNTSWYMPHRNFIEFQGNIYCLKGGATSNDPINFIKFDGTNAINLNTQISNIQSAMIHNNMMYFKGGYLNGGAYFTGIFSFDGDTIRKLDLGSTFAEVALGSSLYGYNNYLFFGNGYSLLKVDLNTVSSTVFATNLSTQSFTTQKITFSPNPTTSTVTFSQEISKLEVYDVAGKKVKSFENANTTFNVEELEKGIYFLKGKTSSQHIFTEKLVKQ